MKSLRSSQGGKTAKSVTKTTVFVLTTGNTQKFCICVMSVEKGLMFGHLDLFSIDNLVLKHPNARSQLCFDTSHFFNINQFYTKCGSNPMQANNYQHGY